MSRYAQGSLSPPERTRQLKIEGESGDETIESCEATYKEAVNISKNFLENWERMAIMNDYATFCIEILRDHKKAREILEQAVHEHDSLPTKLDPLAENGADQKEFIKIATIDLLRRNLSAVSSKLIVYEIMVQRINDSFLEKFKGENLSEDEGDDGLAAVGISPVLKSRHFHEHDRKTSGSSEGSRDLQGHKIMHHSHGHGHHNNQRGQEIQPPPALGSSRSNENRGAFFFFFEKI